MRCSKQKSDATGRLLIKFLSIIFFLLLGSRVGTASEFVLSVVDEDNRPLPCRVLLHDQDGNSPTPPQSIVLTIGAENWFMSDGSTQLEIPVGTYQLRVERGLEFERHKEILEIPDSGLKKQVTLKRWVNMKQRGYLCAENHLHVDSKAVGAMAIAEGLDFASSLTWWNGPDKKRPVSPGTGRTRLLRFADREVTASIYDAELEYGWGAVYIQYLPWAFPYQNDKGRPNFDFLRYANDHGAIIHYQGGWSREVGLDALLGLVHTINICNNNFHLHRFQPRSQYSNLLNVTGFPKYPDTEHGMLQMNTDTYYRLLNWGLYLSAGAGSAIGVKQVPVGYNRTYIKIDPSVKLTQFNEAWKQGRNFVTNGPMLFLEGADGARPGDRVSLEGDTHPFQFKLTAIANQPLQSIEVVQNGRVVKKFKITDPLKATNTFSLDIQKGGWIAARCTVRDDHLTNSELDRYSNPPRIKPSRLRFAHTSPIYFIREGSSSADPVAVREGLQMLDQLEKYAHKNASKVYRNEFIQAIERGREILKSKLDKVN